MKKILAILLILLLLLPQSMAFAYEDIPTLIESDEEFWEWIDSHPYGGSISLSIDITITQHIMLSGPLYIDTGSNGLIFDGGSIYYPLTITGEGVDTPVLTIINPGLRFGSWDYAMPAYNITARGSDGIGGTAVHIKSDKNGDLSFTSSRGLIRSEGTNALGVLLDYPVDAHYLTISVEGEGASAISAQNGANLYYCDIKAEGLDSKAAIGTNILFDTCNITADTTGSEVINRKIIALAGSWLYWPMLKEQAFDDSTLNDSFYLVIKHSFLLSGDDTHPAVVRPLYVIWDHEAIEGIDTTVIGKTLIPGELYYNYQGLELSKDFSLDLTVEILDGSNPCITSLFFNKNIEDNRNYVKFRTNYFYDPVLEPEHGEYILWRSDDYGENWYDFSKSSDVIYDKYSITYYYDEITQPILFCIQEDGGGFSNIAEIYGYEGITYGSCGGDRTGVDRDGETVDTRPSPVPTTAPVPTNIPVPSISPVPTNIPVPTSSPIPTNAPIPTSSPVPTIIPVPTSSPVPSIPPVPTNIPIPTSSPVPTNIPVPTSSPMPTISPMPTNVPEPPSTPAPIEEQIPTPIPVPSSIPSQESVEPTKTPTLTPIPTQIPIPESNQSSETLIESNNKIEQEPIDVSSNILEDTIDNEDDSTLSKQTDDIFTSEQVSDQMKKPDQTPTPYVNEPSITVSEPPIEWEDNKTIAISGKRLKLLMSMGETVSFIKNDIHLSFNTNELESLNIMDDQLLTVTLENVETQQYKLFIILDEEELYGLSCLVSFNSKEYEVSASCTIDFSEVTNDSAINITQTPTQAVDVIKPLLPSDDIEELLISEEEKDTKSPRWMSFGFTFIGTGCVFGGVAAIISKFKK